MVSPPVPPVRIVLDEPLSELLNNPPAPTVKVYALAVWNVETPVTFMFDAMEIVDRPAEGVVAFRPDPKFTDPAVPTVVPLFFIITPDPDPLTPVSPEPSPIKLFAVITPVTVTFVWIAT